MDNPAILILMGVLVGVFSGLMGLGGGAVMIPMMVLILGFSQATAHGTSLAAMIPPVALPAVIQYYRNGNVSVQTAIFLSIGILIGAFFGAYLATWLSAKYTGGLKLVFGFVLIYVAGYTIFGKEHLARTTLLAGLIMVMAIGIYLAVWWYDQRVAAEAAAAAAGATTPS